MISHDDAVTKFNEILRTIQAYIDVASTINGVGRVSVTASIVASTQCGLKHISFTQEKYISSLHKYSDMLMYREHLDGEDECLEESDSDWTHSVTDDVDCPLINLFENSTISNLSYTITAVTPRTMVHKVESKYGSLKPPAHVLIGHLWAYISTPAYEVYSIDIDCGAKGTACVVRRSDYRSYDCTINGKSVNSMRDLRDMLKGSTLIIHHLDDSKTTAAIDELFGYFARYEKPVFERNIDGKVVRWENDKWCDEEYLKK